MKSSGRVCPSLRTGFPFPNYSDGGGIRREFLWRRPINLLRSSKPGACSQAKFVLKAVMWENIERG